VKTDPTPLAGGGLLIQSVEPGSRAAEARLLGGDVLTEFDGVRVLSTRDLVSVPGEHAAWLRIRRGGSAHEEVARVSLVGLAPPPAAALLGPVLVLGLASMLLLLFFAPTPAILVWLEQRIAERLRAPFRARHAARFVATAGSGSALFFGVTTAMFLALPFTAAFGVGDVDVGTFILVAETALATVGLLTAASGRAFSLWRGLVVSARVVSLSIPTVVAVVAVVLSTGSLRLQDLVWAQGGSPWRWTAFASPVALGLLGVWFVAALAPWEDVGGSLPEADTRVPSPSMARAHRHARLIALADRAHLVAMSAVVAAVFLGGWQIPGLAPEQVEAHTGWRCVGAALFAWKAWLVVVAVLGTRWALPAAPVDQVLSLCWRWLIPSSALLLALTAAWTARAPGAPTSMLVGAVTLTIVSATAVHLAMRVRYFLGEAAQPELDSLF
jgi:NADH-quinone oxidoreductase subunit H